MQKISIWHAKEIPEGLLDINRSIIVVRETNIDTILRLKNKDDLQLQHIRVIE